MYRVFFFFRPIRFVFFVKLIQLFFATSRGFLRRKVGWFKVHGKKFLESETQTPEISVPLWCHFPTSPWSKRPIHETLSRIPKGPKASNHLMSTSLGGSKFGPQNGNFF